MASEEQQAENRKLVELNLFKAQGAAPQQAETDAFQCGQSPPPLFCSVENEKLTRGDDDRKMQATSYDVLSSTYPRDFRSGYIDTDMDTLLDADKIRR